MAEICYDPGSNLIEMNQDIDKKVRTLLPIQPVSRWILATPYISHLTNQGSKKGKIHPKKEKRSSEKHEPKHHHAQKRQFLNRPYEILFLSVTVCCLRLSFLTLSWYLPSTMIGCSPECHHVINLDPHLWKLSCFPNAIVSLNHLQAIYFRLSKSHPLRKQRWIKSNVL